MMLPLLITVVIGGPVLAVFCLIMGLMAVKEFYNGFEIAGVKPSFAITAIAAILLYAILFFMRYNYDIFDMMPVFIFWFFAVTVMSLLYLFNIDERNLEDAMATITGIVYILFFSSHIVLIDMKYGGGTNFLGNFPISGIIGNPVWLVIITAYCSDIFAYFSGYFFGRHKLCPKISPKKTVEGAVGGVVGTMIFSALFGYYCMWGSSPLVWGAIGLVVSIISMFGDLTASIFKRKMGIKDYGKLIPGHGGVMDRIDSILFTAPAVYYIMVFMEAFAV